MTITAKNIGRINVWPTYDAAREADTEESEFICGLTVYRTNAEARANLTSEGGGSGLDWVPEGAVIHIDLVRAFNSLDAAWTAADGIVAVDTLLGGDPNTESGWGTTSYDPENLTVDGYVTNDNSLALIGSLRTALLAGGTIRVQEMLLGGGGGYPLISMSSDGDDAVYFRLNTSTGLATVESYNGTLSLETDPVVNSCDFGETVANVFAATLAGDRCEFAVNGSDVEQATLDSTDKPPGNPFVAVAVDPSQNNAVQSITLYDALPSTAGLSELSEVA